MWDEKGFFFIKNKSKPCFPKFYYFYTATHIILTQYYKIPHDALIKIECVRMLFLTYKQTFLIPKLRTSTPRSKI